MMLFSEALFKSNHFVVKYFFVLKLEILRVSRLERPTDVGLNDARFVIIKVAAAIYFWLLSGDSPVINAVLRQKVGVEPIGISLDPRSSRDPNIFGGEGRRVDKCCGDGDTVKFFRREIRIKEESHLHTILTTF